MLLAFCKWVLMYLDGSRAVYEKCKISGPFQIFRNRICIFTRLPGGDPRTRVIFQGEELPLTHWLTGSDLRHTEPMLSFHHTDQNTEDSHSSRSLTKNTEPECKPMISLYSSFHGRFLLVTEVTEYCKF